MTALHKKLSKSWIAAAAGAFFAAVSAMPAEAGGHDRFHHGGGHHGGFQGRQIQRHQMPPQRAPQFNRRAPHMQQQFNRAPDPRIHHMQEQVRRMQLQTRQMQRMAIQRQRMIEQQERMQMRQQRFILQQQWREQQRWGNRHYYSNPGYYSAPVYQQGPTQEDYDECLAVQQENNGCYVDMRGGIHYIEQRQDNGAGAAARILLNTIETINDAAQREQLQKQLLELEQKKKAVEAQRDEAILQRDEALKKALPEPNPTVEQGELNGDEPDAATLPKPATPKP